MSSRTSQTSAATLAALMMLGAPMVANAADAMRVVRDPQTGELRGPTAAEVAAFEKAEAQLRATQSGKAAVRNAQSEIRYSDGTVETPLGDDTRMYSVANVGADGKLRLHCLPAKEARSLVKSSKKSAAAKTEKAGHEHE